MLRSQFKYLPSMVLFISALSFGINDEKGASGAGLDIDEDDSEVSVGTALRSFKMPRTTFLKQHKIGKFFSYLLLQKTTLN